MDILTRRIIRWQRQEKKSELPDEIYQLLSEHTDSKHRRVVSNLARVSRVIDDEGQIRPYDDFKHDWTFEKAEIGEPSSCDLCGHNGIIEHCTLVDRETDKRITLGNVCIDTFMDITTEEQTERVKQVKEYKSEQKKAEFAMQFPSALSDLKRYEGMMTSDSELKMLHKAMVRRLVKQGFPGAKTWKRWELFVGEAEQLLSEWTVRQEELRIEQQSRINEQAMREAAFIQEITNRRNKWNRQSKEWIVLAHSIELNNWEQSMVQRVATKIKVSGQDALKDGHLAFFHSIQIRHKISQPDFHCEDPLFAEVFSWLDLELSDWTRSFCISILIRIVAGENLTKKQESHLISLRKRLSK